MSVGEKGRPGSNDSVAIEMILTQSNEIRQR